MKRYNTVYLLRMREILKAQCTIAASKAQLHLSEWIREAMQDKLNGKRK